ncbi:MAG: hypothetical protein ACOCZ5_03800 [bacterium]
MEKLKRAVIKEELVELTGDYKLAIVLNQFLYWTERVGFDRYNKWIEEETNRERNDVKDLKGGWIYKTSEELINEIMIGVSVSTVRRYIKKLINQGYLIERDNPKYKWDNTKQYRINLINIVIDLDKINYHLEGYKYDDLLEPLSYSTFQNENSDFQYKISDLHNEKTIPEITLENTSKNTDNIYTQLKLSDYQSIRIYNNLYEISFDKEHPLVKTEKLSDIEETLSEILYGYGEQFYINMIKFHFKDCLKRYDNKTAADKSKVDYFVTVKDRYLIDNLDDIRGDE